MRSYTSRYTSKLVTTAQHLAELMCERKAAKSGVSLPDHFWNLVKYKREFLYQVQLANGLLKLYSEEVILNVLAENSKVYSLKANFLDPYFKSEQLRLDKAAQQPKQEDVIPNDFPANTQSKPRPAPKTKPNILTKLRGLDG